MSTLSEQSRLKWKCRRGLLELDLILERFITSNDVAAEDLASLHSLLELPDNDLWDVIAGRSDAYASHLQNVVARLRAA